MKLENHFQTQSEAFLNSWIIDVALVLEKDPNHGSLAFNGF